MELYRFVRNSKSMIELVLFFGLTLYKGGLVEIIYHSNHNYNTEEVHYAS